MLLQPLSDTAVPPIAFQVGGVPTFLILFGVMSLIEAYVLIQRSWGNLKEIAQITLLMNAVSTLAVFLLLLIVYDIWEGFVLAFLLSLVVEGVVLYFRSGRQLRRAMVESFMTNGLSYVLIGSIMAVGLK